MNRNHAFRHAGSYTKLMVVAGHPTRWQAEFIDLIDSETFCQSVANYPHRYGTLGTFVGGRAMVCGGWDVFRQVDECYTYDNLVRYGGVQ